MHSDHDYCVCVETFKLFILFSRLICVTRTLCPLYLRYDHRSNVLLIVLNPDEANDINQTYIAIC